VIAITSWSMPGRKCISKSCLIDLTSPPPSPDVPSNRSNSKQHHWDRTKTIYAQIAKFSKCIFVWVERVIVNEHLLPNFEFILSGAFPSGEVLAIHRKDVSVSIMICRLVSGDNALRCPRSRGDVSVHFPLMNDQNPERMLIGLTKHFLPLM